MSTLCLSTLCLSVYTLSACQPLSACLHSVYLSTLCLQHESSRARRSRSDDHRRQRAGSAVDRGARHGRAGVGLAGLAGSQLAARGDGSRVCAAGVAHGGPMLLCPRPVRSDCRLCRTAVAVADGELANRHKRRRPRTARNTRSCSTPGPKRRCGRRTPDGCGQILRQSNGSSCLTGTATILVSCSGSERPGRCACEWR